MRTDPGVTWKIRHTILVACLAALGFGASHCADEPPAQPLWDVTTPDARAPLPGPFRVIGFWMAPTRGYQWDAEHDTYTPMCAAWRAAGANSVMLNCPDLASARRNLERTRGYSLRFLGGPGLRRVYEWEHLLRDSSVAQGFSGLYLDDGWFAWLYDGWAAPPWTPFSPPDWYRGLDSLFALAEKHDMDLGVNVYEIEGIRLLTALARDYDTRHRDPATGAPTTRREQRLIIYTGARYFDAGPTFLAYSDAVRAHALRNNIPLSRLQPWIAPSCETPRAAAVYRAPGCEASWTLTLILRLAELRFGGIHVYLGNGMDEAHRDQMLLAFWATGNLHLPAFPRPSTYGEFRTILSDSSRLAPVLLAARSLGIPTHRPGWLWTGE